MKILKIQVEGLKLYSTPLEIDFYAEQNVSSEKNEMLTNIVPKIYINNVVSLVGINASGKTTTLKVISFVMQLLEAKPINTIKYNTILEGLNDQEKITFNIFFVTEKGKISKLNTVIKCRNSLLDLKNKYYIESEKIWSKSAKSLRSKKSIFDFSEVLTYELERKNDELFLLDDVSIIVAYNKKNNTTLSVIDSIDWTDYNALRSAGDFPEELVRFLDPSIEYLSCKLTNERSKFEIRLKFFNKKELVLQNILELNRYLSSGTLKGINVFTSAMVALNTGSYLIIDELEIHFNKEIVATLIRFFMDSEINKKGAVLIFSTHYIELLDNFERNDNIYIIKNIEGIKIEKLSYILSRNDVKKSDLFQSGYLENTTPNYDAYIALKRKMKNIRLIREAIPYE